jgi:hypothetical protein
LDCGFSPIGFQFDEDWEFSLSLLSLERSFLRPKDFCFFKESLAIPGIVIGQTAMIFTVLSL